LWIDPAGREQLGDPNDVVLFAWFMRYAATAVSHGQLPQLVSSAMNAPAGFNLMWNTSFLLPGVVLAPVTMLLGPQVSLTIVLTLGFAGSAAALFWVLRRWGASVWAAGLGGAVYGFSPALVVSGYGHFHLEFAVLPPLIIDAVLRLITGRGRTVRTGIWLGLMCAAQVFIGEEMFVYTVVAGAFVVILVALCRPLALLERAPRAIPGLAIAGTLFLALDGYALWKQFKGPFAEHTELHGSLIGNLAWFVVPSNSVLFHTSASAAEAATVTMRLPAEYVSYIGWPLILVVVVAGIVFWRDLRVRVAALTWLLLELCALGGGTLRIGGFKWHGKLLPWHWLQGLPGLAQVLPWRFSILADAAAAAVLVFALDRALAAARPRGFQRPALAAIAVLAVLPLVPLPYHVAKPPPVPAGWQATFSDLRLPQSAPVLVLPFPYATQTQAMRWYADTGDPGSMIGGYFIGPGTKKQAAFYFETDDIQTQVARRLNRVWSGINTYDPPNPVVRSIVVNSWHTAAIVVVSTPGTRIITLLTQIFGAPTHHLGTVYSWKLLH
jgi:hypothetical protein